MPQIPISGDLNSSWWRCMRFLLEDGKPLPHLLRLAIGPTSNGKYPFGALCKTKNDLLIFWQPLEKELPAPTVEHPHIITDHITLELWSGKSHPTWYDANGERKSPDQSLGWKWEILSGSNVSHWFSMLLQFSVIEEQDCEVHADVASPTNDVARRTEKFKQHWAESALVNISLPPLPHFGNYVCCSFFVTTAREKSCLPDFASFMSRLPLWEHVQPDGPSLPTRPQVNLLDIEEVQIAIVTACPGGNLREKNILAASKSKPS